MDYGASDLRERVEVLELAETEAGWAWTPARETWAGVEVTDKTNLFSKVGIGARDVTLVLRAQGLTLGHALRWRGRHLFLTGLTETRRGWLDGRAALVDPVECRGDVHLETPGKVFPGVLTEKYVGQERAVLTEKHVKREPMTTHITSYILVTPKAIALRRGGVVWVEGELFAVQTAHRLDPHKNEYEVIRKDDL